MQSIRQTSLRYLGDSLDLVKALPYWDRRRGADHFVVFTADAGRCAHLLHLESSIYQELFVLQHHGALETTTLLDSTSKLPARPCFRSVDRATAALTRQT